MSRMQFVSLRLSGQEHSLEVTSLSVSTRSNHLPYSKLNCEPKYLIANSNYLKQTLPWTRRHSDLMVEEGVVFWRKIKERGQQTDFVKILLRNRGRIARR